MLVLKRLIAFITTSVPVFVTAAALAATGQPEPWQLGMQKGATPVMDDIIWFHDFLLWVISAITLFVLALLGDNRGAFVSLAVLSAQRAEGGRDGESHGQAVVLELQLS
jgi:heme/copper-type cytochrome/quinol oxidase subunit 2